MFPNSSNLGHPPFLSNHQHQSTFLNKLPLNIPPALASRQEIVDAQFNFQNAVLSRTLLSGNIATIPAVTPQPVTYGNDSPVRRSDASTSFRGRKRLSGQSVPHDVKRQRFHSHNSETTVVNQAVPSPEERRFSFPGSVQSPVFCARYIPDLPASVLPLQDSFFPHPKETTLPVAKDKLSQQVLELFQVCQQQISDLNRKELCRTELQREIQRIFPQSRLFLVGSSLNGFGTRSSDGDLCLVVKEEPTCDVLFDAVPCIAVLNNHPMVKGTNHKFKCRLQIVFVDKCAYPDFNSSLEASYIQRPHLIRAKVPIVKFRDKVSCVEFDLNVNNVVGIRNTFLLRTYAYIESRVRPLVLVIKKWARFHDINDASRGTLNSYSLVLMVLHYLQTLPEPVLPSLQKNYPESFDPTMHLHLVHRIPYTIPPYLSRNGSSLGDLLLGFFKYYATEFDWSRQMISVREAKAVPRPDGIEWRNKFICVEEPFDGTNTARAVHEKQKFDIIRSEFLKSWQILRDTKNLNCILPLRASTEKN